LEAWFRRGGGPVEPPAPGGAGELFHKAAVYWSAVRDRIGPAVIAGAALSRAERRVPKKPRNFSFSRAAQSLQENVTRSGPVAAAAYTLVGGILLLGGIGYALDGWLDTGPWLLLAGLLLGIVVGFYELVKTVWRR
jgi:F0F1-type ATP synthase assembly protein I